MRSVRVRSQSEMNLLSLHVQTDSAGWRAGAGENRPNVIRQRVPPANEKQEAEIRAYTVLTQMLLWQISRYYQT